MGELAGQVVFLGTPSWKYLATVFPYAVLFVDQPERVLIGVMHLKRRPGYWRMRISR